MSYIYIAGDALSPDDAFPLLRDRYPRRTLRRYDLPPCPEGPITPEQVTRTRAVNSRISDKERAWFVGRGLEWQEQTSHLAHDADLRDADPEQQGGLYDGMLRLWQHYWADRPRHISIGKVSKVLHLKYPALIPILDSRVRTVYRDPAKQNARQSDRWQSQVRRLNWGAIRSDLIASTAGLGELRELLAQEPDLSDFLQLTDLRLLDCLTWRP